MKYRKLRIAWSVAWGVACVLLIVLWVRSYWWVDGMMVGIRPSTNIGFGSVHGVFLIGVSGNLSVPTSFVSRVPVEPVPDNWLKGLEVTPEEAHFYSSWKPIGYFAGMVKMTYWFAASLLTAIGVAPWLRWRFSLRTLLIGMTVAAIGLGWIVYAFRS